MGKEKIIILTLAFGDHSDRRQSPRSSSVGTTLVSYNLDLVFVVLASINIGNKNVLVGELSAGTSECGDKFHPHRIFCNQIIPINVI